MGSAAPSGQRSPGAIQNPSVLSELFFLPFARTGTGTKCCWSWSPPRGAVARRTGWLHPYIHPCCGLCPVLTVCAHFYFIYFTRQAKDSIKLFRQFDYLLSVWSSGSVSSVSAPQQCELVGGTRPTSHTVSCSNPAPCALHSDDSSLLSLDETDGKNMPRAHRHSPLPQLLLQHCCKL